MKSHWISAMCRLKMRLDEAFKTLVGLIEKAAGSAATRAESGSEDVLVDTEVKGARYLLVRMPQAAGVRPIEPA
jgi:hypothetical protein